jgi:hypothetical protein
MFLSYLIVSLTSLLFGFAGAAFLFKRHYRNTEHRYMQYEQELERQREAIRTIMYRTHHNGINPISKRIRGLCTLGFMVSDRLLNFLNLLSKPHHQGYSKLAIAESNEIRSFFRLIEQQALGLETETLDNVKEFEHLQ